MSQKVKQPDGDFRIAWQGYDTDDPKRREERVDVSPAGTEGYSLIWNRMRFGRRIKKINLLN